MSFLKSPKPVEIVLATLLSLVSGASLLAGLCLLATGAANPAAKDLAFAPICSGPGLASLGSLLILWLRNRKQMDWLLTLVAGVVWFIGTTVFISGITTTLLYKNAADFAQNLGWSLIFCLTPGAFMSLVGLALLGAAYARRPRHTLKAASAPAVDLSRQDKVQRASEYRSRVADLIRQKESPALVQQMTTLLPELDEWVNRVQELDNRINSFHANTLIQQDIHSLPATLTRLSEQLNAERDPALRAQIQYTLDGYRKQHSQLEALVSLMRRTELEIDQALAAMGTIYSGLQLLGAKEIDSARAQSLRGDIEEQVKRMGDLISGVDQVYGAL